MWWLRKGDIARTRPQQHLSCRHIEKHTTVLKVTKGIR